ncbi:MAG: hypothetical protein MJE63_33540 [Proteobacteria bacterium]|nr:hypothetical protein [Pseudomonadota bacterium]
MPNLKDLQLGNSIILTNIARSYSNSELIGEKVFPTVEVEKENAKIPQWDKSSFRVFNTRRAVNSDGNYIPPGSVTTIPVDLHEEELRSLIDTRENDCAEFDIQAQRTREARDGVLLSAEVRCANLVQDPSQYPDSHQVTLSKAEDKLSSDKSDPKGLITDGKREIRYKIGKIPNTLVMGYNVYCRLKEHPQLKSTFNLGNINLNRSVTEQVMTEEFEVERIMVGNAVCVDPVTDNFVDIWNDNIALIYQPALPNKNVPAFGYTFRLKGYPRVKKYWRDGSRKIMVVEYTDLLSHHIIGPEAGYLIASPL